MASKTTGAVATPSGTHPAKGYFEYAAGLDIGNGYVKGVIEDRARAFDLDRATLVSSEIVDMPSAAVIQTHASKAPLEDSQASSTVADADKWFNAADIGLTTPMIRDKFRRLIGRRAVAAGGDTEVFDLVGNQSKAHQDLSKVLVLSIIGSKAVRDFVLANDGKLPGSEGSVAALTAKVTLALALPINEYMVHKDTYAAEFLGDRSTGKPAQVHSVTFNNFVTPVTVNISFEAVLVGPEGASAQYAINHYGTPLMERMLDDVRERGYPLPEGISPADLYAAENTIGVDVGEGTVNFPVFTGGEFNSDMAATMHGGYGSVLEKTILAMDDKGVRHGFANRKALAEELQRPAPLTLRAFRAKIDAEIAEQVDQFVKLVSVNFGRVLERVGARTEVIYVYGGGSGPMREALYPVLQQRVTEINGEFGAPVLYLDASYSRGLNRQGLIIAARNMVKRSAKGA